MTADDIAVLLPGARRTSNGWEANCPAHDDRKASLSIHQEPDGKVLMDCHAGCDTKDVLAKLGLSWRDLFPPDKQSDDPGKRLKSKRRSFKADKKVVATYDYVNENGELLYQVQRTERKEFIQRRRVVRENVAKWVYDMKGVTRVLYRLPRVNAAVAAGGTIYIVEGEKDVHSLEAWGLVGTTQSGGASAKWLDSFSNALAGADVIVIPDNDTPGRKLMETVARSLKPASSRVRALILPGLKEHGDFTDWVEAGGTPEELAALVAEASDFEPESIHKEYKAPKGIARISVNNVPLRDVGKAAIAALVAANSPPYFFLKGGEIVRYRVTELSLPLIERANEAILGSRLADVADFVYETEELEKLVNPPRDVIRYVVSDAHLPFPKLVGVTESPILRPDGTILQKPGYDPDTGYYYSPPDGFNMPDVPVHPTKEQLADAVDLVQEVFCDIPFVDEASRTNTVALMLTPLVRSLVPTVPIAYIDAKNQGTGKSLVSEVCGMIACGTYNLGTAPFDTDEWRKRITSLLAECARFVVFDNVQGLLSSQSLSAVLTTGRWSDRRLGTLETAMYPNNATWVATGNNLQTDADLARRGYLISLDARCARPYERKRQYKHPELREWVALNRGDLLAALFTLIRAWYSAGQPDADIAPMGSFETWTRIIGGIIAHAGLPDFNANRGKLLREADPESSGWERFLRRWLELYGDVPKTVSQIKDDLVSAQGFENVLPDALSHAVKGGVVNPNRVGKAFRSKEGTRFGDDGLHLRRAGVNHQAILWTVKRSTTPESGEFGEFGELLTSENMRAHVHTHACAHAYACDTGPEKTPQTPHPPQSDNGAAQPETTLHAEGNESAAPDQGLDSVEV